MGKFPFIIRVYGIYHEVGKGILVSDELVSSLPDPTSVPKLVNDVKLAPVLDSNGYVVELMF